MNESWIRLDNAAKIYPASANRNWHALFRLSATLTEPVDAAILQRTIMRLEPRFPTFFMRLKRGMFWYYLERNAADVQVRADGAYPCAPMRFSENGGYLFRVLVYDCRIAVEFFHALTDGTGGLCFLKTLVAEYLTLRYGAAIPRDQTILDCDMPPASAEIEDSFLKNIGPVHTSRREQAAYHITGTPFRDSFVLLTSGVMDANALHGQAKGYGVSVTTFLTAVLIEAAQRIQAASGVPQRKQKQVKINVPVNLRQFFDSRTVRNFASYVNPGIDPRMGDYSFEEIIKIVHHHFGTEVTEKRLSAKFTANVLDERKTLLRIAPLFLKDLVMRLVFLRAGDRLTTTCMSNLGVQTLPPEMARYVSRMDFILGPLAVNRVACSAISYNGTVVFSFIRTIREPVFERAFFTGLIEHGVPVTIESNQYNQR